MSLKLNLRVLLLVSVVATLSRSVSAQVVSMPPDRVLVPNSERSYFVAQALKEADPTQRVGLLVKALENADDPCAFLPQYHTDFFLWVLSADPNFICPSGGILDSDCVKAEIIQYYKDLEELNQNWYDAYCYCLTYNPIPSPALVSCLQDVEDRTQHALGVLQNNLKALLGLCCNQPASP